MNARVVVAVAALLLTLLWSTTAQAQVFSPGPLSAAHADLEGMGNCKRCHGDGSQHDNSRCLECHTEVQRRQASRSGYHGRLGAQLCAECHREHRGVAAKIVEWPGGGQKAFNHSLTTWPLVGRHKKGDCRACHDSRRIEDKDALALQQKGRDTFLGLPTACADCHFDEHRSREHGNRPGADCARCHTPEAFAPAPRFNHNDKGMAQFALTGRHQKVDCQKCHTPVVDDGSAGAFPAPKGREYLQFNDIPHTSCVDCHDDPHRGNFGRTCTRCHTTSGWQQILQTAEDTGFHDKTKFPLRGGHTSVACKTCHGPFPGQRAVFKGLKHERCSDCHMDAHVGQLAATKSVDDPSRCDRCHSVTGFSPSTFSEAAHDKTRQPLQGAHKAIACAACHSTDPGLAKKVPAAVRASLTRQKRALLTADVRLTLPQLKTFKDVDDGQTIRCDGCHKDPHGGQFTAARERAERTAALDDGIATRSCAACHQTSSFRDETFRHDDSAFPLVGKHKDVACSKCHVKDTAQARGRRKEAAVVRYRGVTTRCSDCHTDEHVGQLAKDGVTDCARCHGPTGFKPSTFDHKDPLQTRFVLQGRHTAVQCAKCHVAVRVPAVDDEGETTARYRPLPIDCAACHEDEHEGQRFERFVP